MVRPGKVRDIDVDPLGEQRVMLDHRAEHIERHGIGIANKEDHVRIADIDRHRASQRALVHWPTHRHPRGVHRVGERDRIPIEARRAHVDPCASLCGLEHDRPSAGGDSHRLAMQQRHRSCGIAAGLDLAAIGIEDPHPERIGRIRLKQHQLVAADAGAPVSQRARDCWRHRRQCLLTRIEHDKVIAEPVHLGEGDPLRHGCASMHARPARPVPRARERLRSWRRAAGFAAKQPVQRGAARARSACRRRTGDGALPRRFRACHRDSPAPSACPSRAMR